ncbi:hypothetical protein MKW92_040095 [Papaver armeniacum]|nr:hypothetical protein MKW92_003947 [Papaver armeniacum]KAI3962379.1 hypothetical protein MKW92_040095 [Papaver armeniacum]
MKFAALISLLVLCLMVSNTGVVSAYTCEKAVANGSFKGPCQQNCGRFCYLKYLGGGKCNGNQCKCSYVSKAPCA